jgi:hypothetical protein
MTGRLTHTAQHRGQLMAILRMLGRDLHGTYGPIAGTAIYGYATLEKMLEEEARGGAKIPLPPPGDKPVTERPQ